MTDAISDEFDRALAGLCADTRLRAIEGGADDGAEADTLWAEVDALGFTDALVGVEQGGAGLTLDDACSLLIAAGHAGLNHPFGETMVARKLLAQAGWRPDGRCIAVAKASLSESGELACTEVPGAALAGHVLAEAGDEWLLLPVDAAASTAGAFRPHASASLRWTGASLAVTRFPRHGTSAETICNAVHAAAMAGALARVLALSVAYAGDRRQFGKAIGQFQAVQQQLAVLTEDACSAAVAARMGCSAAMLPDPLHAATAKLRACEAAARGAATAHAVHGAIGITEEHALGLFTNRLHEWRMTPGTEGRCAQQLGEALLADNGLSFADFTRTRLTPTLPMVAC
ncbi:acyl-CoA dehydrogenase family protein [Cupriavidus metallidurans]|uniref:acyl-CoA dehydrogenase family protein n=1 Tax=Cupriavidus metallidurans TaxID=119219 RepID=UPI001CCD2F4E|nr:acyl-CoA dehydrogenase family protein [Cupriavidus metallidurans]UBM08186.1 acyl-CoA dehydrogenase [Cupriavidus metallidurans]